MSDGAWLVIFIVAVLGWGWCWYSWWKEPEPPPSSQPDDCSFKKGL